jgi:hypothetical protein
MDWRRESKDVDALKSHLTEGLSLYRIAELLDCDPCQLSRYLSRKLPIEYAVWKELRASMPLEKRIKLSVKRRPKEFVPIGDVRRIVEPVNQGHLYSEYSKTLKKVQPKQKPKTRLEEIHRLGVYREYYLV